MERIDDQKEIERLCCFLIYVQDVDVQILVELQEWFEKRGQQEILESHFKRGCLAAATANILEEIIFDRVSLTASALDLDEQMTAPSVTEDVYEIKSSDQMEQALVAESGKQVVNLLNQVLRKIDYQHGDTIQAECEIFSVSKY